MTEQLRIGREPLRGKAMQKATMDLAKQKQWRRASFPPVKTERGWRVPVGGDSKGWPDLVLVRERLLVIEFKGDGDRMRYVEQTEWQSAFRMAGVDARVWTAQDWLDGTIETELTVRRPSAVDLGWAAGMWEASGYISERGELRVHDQSEERAQRLAQILGGKVLGPYAFRSLGTGERFLVMVAPGDARLAAEMLCRVVRTPDKLDALTALVTDVS